MFTEQMIQKFFAKCDHKLVLLQTLRWKFTYGFDWLEKIGPQLRINDQKPVGNHARSYFCVSVLVKITDHSLRFTSLQTNI